MDQIQDRARHPRPSSYPENALFTYLQTSHELSSGSGSGIGRVGGVLAGT